MAIENALTKVPKRKRGRPKGSKNKNNYCNNRCISISKFNVRCTKKKLKNSQYCGHHQPVPENERCCAISKTNNLRCTKRRINNKRFCGHHVQNHHLYQHFDDFENLPNKKEKKSKNKIQIKENKKILNNCHDENIDADDSEPELFEYETNYINIVVNNQLWKFYPEYEKWIKECDNFDDIKDYYDIKK